MARLRARWASYLLVGLIALITLVVRWYRIGAESIWLDEATSIYLAKMPIAEMIRWTAADIHPPLYYILLHLVLRLGDSETIVRALSAQILALVGDTDSIDALGSLLYDEIPLVSRAAAKALAYLGDKHERSKSKATRALFRALADGERELQLRVLPPLTRLSDRNYELDIEEWERWVKTLP